MKKRVTKIYEVRTVQDLEVSEEGEPLDDGLHLWSFLAEKLPPGIYFEVDCKCVYTKKGDVK